MLILTKLNGEHFTLNCELVEKITENPDTTIELTNGNMYIVSETMEQVVNATIMYKRQIFKNLLR